MDNEATRLCSMAARPLPKLRNHIVDIANSKNSGQYR